MKSILLKVIPWVIAVLGLVTFAFGKEDKNLMVDFSLLVLVIAAIVTILFSVLNIFKNPELLKRVLLGVAILLGLLVLSYVIADNGAVFNAAGEQLVGEGSTSRWVGTGIIYSIILLTIGAALFLWDMVKNAAK